MSKYITTTHGMRGFFAVMIDDSDGFPDPFMTGHGSYKNSEDAKKEAKDWAKAEEMEYRE